MRAEFWFELVPGLLRDAETYRLLMRWGRTEFVEEYTVTSEEMVEAQVAEDLPDGVQRLVNDLVWVYKRSGLTPVICTSRPGVMVSIGEQITDPAGNWREPSK
ncbi:MAG: hypothetical protein C4524_07325 [Candidatus Zixiibacteriota bacterium]|nr:MAG: hypothetical protein C4524_07325 [candidate division Zixibacteria bacterium]